jgi:predicted ATPase
VAALDRLDDALARVECTDERFYEAEFHRLRGEALRALAPPRPCAPENAFRTAIRIARRQGARLLERRAVESLRAQGPDLVRHNSSRSRPESAH